jgi:U-box domain
MEISSSRKFSCPLTNTIMEDPVAAPCCGANFERHALLNWMRKNGNRCPQSGEPLLPSDLNANPKLQWEILYLERRSGDLFFSERGSSSCGRLTNPRSKVDTPPILPRSPSEVSLRKSIKKKTASACQRCSSPPSPCWPRPRPLSSCVSRCSVSAMAIPALTCVDSAPILPRRFNMGTPLLEKHLFSEAAGFHHDGCESGPSSSRTTPTRTANRQKESLTLLIDKALAVLEST